MKSWKHFQGILHLLLGIHLMFVARIGSHVHSSPLANEVGRSDSYFESTNKKTSPPHYEKNYITERYFEKYDSLIDSQFKNFMNHELSISTCEGIPSILNLDPRLSILERSLIGEGSHRRISSTIKLDIRSEYVSLLAKHSCEIIYVEKLPSGVFSDPFELQHLHRGVFTDVVVFGDTNLELPSVHSNRSLVEVHMDIGPSLLSRIANALDINVELSLHSRYPPLVDSGYYKVEFGEPEFFMQCDTKEKSDSQQCLLMIKDDDGESRKSVVWNIPSGIETQARVVSIVTFSSAILSTLLIVLSSIYYKDIKSCNKIKQL